MNKSAIFSKAHKLAKAVIKAGDNYAVTFAACLKEIYKEIKMAVKNIDQLLIAAGAKIWEKGSMKRIYINDAVAQKVFNENLLREFSQVKIKVGKSKFYYDINSGVFGSDSGSIRSAINGTSFDHGYKCTK